MKNMEMYELDSSGSGQRQTFVKTVTNFRILLRVGSTLDHRVGRRSLLHGLRFFLYRSLQGVRAVGWIQIRTRALMNPCVGSPVRGHVSIYCQLLFPSLLLNFQR
jgi:hypothetical protein